MMTLKRKLIVIIISLSVVLVSGCGSRAMTTGEIVLASEFYGNSVNYDEVKIKKGGLADVVTESGGSVVDNVIYLNSKIYLDDLSESIYIDNHALFVHELGHIWQFQNKIESEAGKPYRWNLAAKEHAKYGDDVYKYPKLTGTECFSNFRFEQQGKILQDYVVIRVLGPKEKRKNYQSVIYGTCGIEKGTTLPKELKFRNVNVVEKLY